MGDGDFQTILPPFQKKKKKDEENARRKCIRLLSKKVYYLIFADTCIEVIDLENRTLQYFVVLKFVNIKPIASEVLHFAGAPELHGAPESTVKSEFFVPSFDYTQHYSRKL